MSITRYSFQKGIVYVVVLIIPIAHSVFAQSVHETGWKEDLKIYKESLEQKHIDLYHSVTKEAFYNDWNTIYNSADTLNDFEIILKLMRLTRRINDGHTAISLRNIATHRFPFEIEWIEGQWHVIKTLPENKQLLKTSLASINGIPMDTIVQKVSAIAQFVENEYSLKQSTGSSIPIAELLVHLDLIDSKTKATFGFRNEANALINLDLEAMAHEIWENSEVYNINLTVPGIERPKIADAGFWFTPISGRKALYIHFTDYPSFEKMQVFGEELVALIQENDLKQVIIDMRENGGGDLYVGTVLAYALNLADSIDWKHGVFVLTSNKTFSAATSNAALFKQLLNAKTVGQPTGSNPNGYQDMDSFILPNSNLVITYSKRLFRLSSLAKIALQPDFLLHQKRDDLYLGTDTVLKELIQNW